MPAESTQQATPTVVDEETAMTRLVADRYFDCGDTRHITLLHPPLTYCDLPNEDYKAFCIQDFAWHPNGVTFHCKLGEVWLTVYESTKVEVNGDTEKAILVPFEIPSEGYINLAGDDTEGALEVSPGQYQLLFELRELTTEELLSVDKYAEFGYSLETDPPEIEASELCMLTFVPTREKIEPQLLKFEPNIPWHYESDIREGRLTRESFIPKTLMMFDTLLTD